MSCLREGCRLAMVRPLPARCVVEIDAGGRDAADREGVGEAGQPVEGGGELGKTADRDGLDPEPALIAVASVADLHLAGLLVGEQRELLGRKTPIDTVEDRQAVGRRNLGRVYEVP